MKLQQLTATLDSLESEYELDVIDLRLLSVMQHCWDKGKDIRITDLVRNYKIASPATIHKRVSEELVAKKMIKLKENPKDKRERLIVENSEFKNVIKFIGK
jgi:hypothetical protein